jgi:hypothetical protein
MVLEKGMPMKADQLLKELKALAEKLGIEVSEQNFRKTGIIVKSGFCKVKGNDHFLIDKHLKPSKKVEVLAEYLALQPLEEIFIIPALREYLEQYQKRVTPSNSENMAPSDQPAAGSSE